MALAFLAVAVLTPATVHPLQQPDSIRADSVTRLRAVEVTETRAATTVGGASAVIVKTEELRSSPAPLLEQALRESPFVLVRQNSRGEMELSIRGSDSRQVAVLLDGVPLTVGWDHRTDPSLVPLTGAQNLVIVRGLASLLNGPNTLGGTVEISQADAGGPPRPRPARLWGGAGVDENGANTVSVGIESGAAGTRWLSGRAGVTRRQRDGFALAAGVGDATAVNGLRTNSDLQELDVFAGLRLAGAAGRSVGLTVSAFDAERGVPPEEHVSSPRLWRYPYHRRAVAALSAASGTFASGIGYASLDLGVGYNVGESRIDSYSDRSYRSVTASELGDERTFTSRLLLTHSLPGAARLRAATTLARVRYGETLLPAARADYEQGLSSAGAEIDVPLGTATSLAAGAVYDRTTTPLTGGRTPGQQPFAAAGWRLGLTHDPNPEWRLHASVNRRARFPSLRELYSGALDRFAPNPDLDPEKLIAFESGFIVDRRLGPIPDATLQLSAFQHNLDNAIARTTLADGRFLRVNRDRIQSAGVELLAGLALGTDRDRSLSITGDALLQRIRVHDRSAGAVVRHAENNPEARGMLEIGIPLPAAMRGTTNLRYVGRQYCLNPETGQEITLFPSREASAAAERGFIVSRSGALRYFRVLLALDNATNAAVYDQCGLSQPGRTLRLMVTAR